MDILESYRRYCFMTSKTLRNSSINYISKSPKSFDLHLYLLTNAGIQSKAMSIRKNESAVYYSSKLLNKNNTFQVIIPDIYNKYSLSIISEESNDLFTCTDKLYCYFYCGRHCVVALGSVNELLGFADWLNIKPDKINKAIELLAFNKKLIDKSDIPYGSKYKSYVSEYSLRPLRAMDIFKHFTTEFTPSNYIVYSFEGAYLKKHIYLYIEDADRYTNQFLYIPIDDDRSILLRYRVGMALFKNNQIVYYSRVHNGIDVFDIASMLKRTDIIELIEKIRFFDSDNWQKQIEVQ